MKYLILLLVLTGCSAIPVRTTVQYSYNTKAIKIIEFKHLYAIDPFAGTGLIAAPNETCYLRGMHDFKECQLHYVCYVNYANDNYGTCVHEKFYKFDLTQGTM